MALRWLHMLCSAKTRTAMTILGNEGLTAEQWAAIQRRDAEPHIDCPDVVCCDDRRQLIARIAALESALREGIRYAGMVRSSDIAGDDPIFGWLDDAAKLLGIPLETAAKSDDHHPGELWSFLRSVMLQGQDIALDYREKGYEEMSARLDVAAGDRVDKLLALLNTSKTGAKP